MMNAKVKITFMPQIIYLYIPLPGLKTGFSTGDQADMDEFCTVDDVIFLSLQL